MTALEQIEQHRILWGLALPHLPTPDPQIVVRWVEYPLQSVEHAILRTAKRFTREKVGSDFDPNQAYRFVTGTARQISKQARPVR